MPEKTGKSSLIYAAAIFAAIAGVLFGFNTGIISGALLFIKNDFVLTAFQEEVVVSAVLLGALIGSGLSGQLTDSLGRRRVLLITAVVFVLGSLASALAPSEWFLIISRFVVGLAIGTASFTAPLYIAEIAPQKNRGFLVSFNQVAITSGILLSYIANYAFAGMGSWRWMLGIGVVPAVILFLGALFIPESPRWLLLKGKTELARDTLQRLRAKQNIEHEFNEIKQTISHKKVSFKELGAKWVRPILFIGIGLSLFQQITGINTIIYYAPTIFQMAGFKEAGGAILATVGIGLVNLIFTFVSLPLIDRWGRRPLLLYGLSGMFLSLAILAIAFHFPGFSALRWFAIGSMVFYIICFAMSMGPVMWLIVSEIYPLNIRGLGASVAVAAGWTFNLLVSLTFLTLINVVGSSGTFWLFAVLCIIAWIFVFFIVPETKGVSLEHIEKSLRTGMKGRRLGS